MEANIFNRFNLRVVFFSGLITILTACAAPNEAIKSEAPDTASTNTKSSVAVVDTSSSNRVNTPTRQKRPKAEIYKGTGSLVNKTSSKRGSARSVAGDDVTLMFQDAPIEEVATTILGDLMGMAYVIDERVAGTVSLKTGRPIPRDALVAVMEGILKSNNAVLVENNGVFHIVPAEENLSSIVSPSFKLDANKGYQVIVVPLRYIAAGEMKNILGSIQGAEKNIQIDPRRNLIMVSGTQSELANMLDTIEIFDIDQLKGMSTGIFRLARADAATVADELNSIFNYGADGHAVNSVIKFLPIERLNAILAISSQARYLDSVDEWVVRLDQVDSAINRTLHVYFVQNVRAAYLAGILQNLFDADVDTVSDDSAGQLAPGLSGSSQTGFGGASDGDGESENGGLSFSSGAESLDSAVPTGPTGGGLESLQRRTAFSSDFGRSTPSSGGGGSDSPVKIIADEENNALVIKATAEEYDEIKDAIARLDVVPLQVLVEATIVEVQLTGDLTYGLEWFFRNNNVADGNDGIGRLDIDGGGVLDDLGISRGFSYSIVDSAGLVRATLNALAEDSKIRVISSPSLMVLDNHAASINVGDQVPVLTSESTNTATSGDDSIVTSTIQYVETGVTLEVAPRVSTGGSVSMDIFQSIRTADTTITSDIDSPTINQRQVQTSVAIQSGDTIVLGGLIQDDEGRSNSGIPGLRNLPVAGFLFGTTAKTSRRTELLVLITPTAVQNSTEAKEATAELRDKLEGLKLPELESDGTIKAIEHKGIRW